MHKYFTLILLVFILGACNKVKKTEKILTGVWSLYQYKVTNNLGLVYYYPVQGTMDFGSCGGAKCNYSLRADYTKDGIQMTKYEDGIINISETDKFTLDRIEADGSMTHIEDGRFLLITKDDIKLVYSDVSTVHEFILQKN